MINKKMKTTTQWVDLIANNELPAITSTAKMLDKFSSDDKSSLPKLSKAILHDQALSSCLLKVANNIHHIGVSKVTTVSRASVILGMSAVKNICLTSKLVESLLENKNVSIHVYNRLTQLMANSFYAGMLAKMMSSQYNEDTQEEMYLAAMLYRIGETAFWSTGDVITERLIKHSNLSDNDFSHYCIEQLGSSFTELSIGLTSTWNLSDLLLKALDDPTSRTDEIKIIYFADKLSTSIANPTSAEEFNTLLEDIASIMHVSVRKLKKKISETREQVLHLLSSYGASILKKQIKPLPVDADFEQNRSPVFIDYQTKEKSLLALFIRLTKMMKNSNDFNDYLQVLLAESVSVFGFERCSFLMLADNGLRVKSRFVYNLEGEENIKISIHLAQSKNIIGEAIALDKPMLINDYQQPIWQDLMAKEIVTFINDGALAVVPVKIKNKIIGVICVQSFLSNHEIASEDFNQFCSLVDHLNMCLTMTIHHSQT